MALRHMSKKTDFDYLNLQFGNMPKTHKFENTLTDFFLTKAVGKLLVKDLVFEI